MSLFFDMTIRSLQIFFGLTPKVVAVHACIITETKRCLMIYVCTCMFIKVNSRSSHTVQGFWDHSARISACFFPFCIWPWASALIC